MLFVTYFISEHKFNVGTSTPKKKKTLSLFVSVPRSWESFGEKWWHWLLQVVLMLLEKDERRHMTQLFEHLSAVESAEFTKNDVQNLANKYIWTSSLCSLLHELLHHYNSWIYAKHCTRTDYTKAGSGRMCPRAIQWNWVTFIQLVCAVNDLITVCLSDSLRNIFFSPGCFTMQIYFCTTTKH